MTCPTAEECTAFLQSFADIGGGAVSVPPEVTRIARGMAELRQLCGRRELRPGGILSGPAQMQMADTAAYVAVFSHLGLVPEAVTSSLSIEFLRAARGGVLHARATTARHGRVLTVVNVRLWTEDESAPCSQAVVVYTVPKAS